MGTEYYLTCVTCGEYVNVWEKDKIWAFVRNHHKGMSWYIDNDLKECEVVAHSEHHPLHEKTFCRCENYVDPPPDATYTAIRTKEGRDAPIMLVGPGRELVSCRYDDPSCPTSYRHFELEDDV